LPTRGGEPIGAGDLDAIWWRRVGASQPLPEHLADEGQIDLINNDCRAALLGVLLAEFGGAWISDPMATTRAENKLLQLQTAALVGLSVPPTLVSQNPEEIRCFCAARDNRVIVKPVLGTGKVPIITTELRQEHLLSDQSMSLCPAIYQERVDGEAHLRVCCFGNAVYALVLHSQELDWRPNLDIPVERFNMPGDLTEKLQEVLRLLGLKMGIFDLKLSPDGEPWWLEVNPQGQFLFLEGLSGVELTSAFADYLQREIVRG
jgi:glutathione synthase/RimK-type ligase-like ATP-grasp enzyme